MNSFRCIMACAQKATSREVSEMSKPTLDLNHCRLESMMVTKAIGVPQIWAAKVARLSKLSSGGVSRIWYLRRVAMRLGSSLGMGTVKGFEALQATGRDLACAGFGLRIVFIRDR